MTFPQYKTHTSAQRKKTRGKSRNSRRVAAPVLRPACPRVLCARGTTARLAPGRLVKPRHGSVPRSTPRAHGRCASESRGSTPALRLEPPALRGRRNVPRRTRRHDEHALDLPRRASISLPSHDRAVRHAAKHRHDPGRRRRTARRRAHRPLGAEKGAAGIAARLCRGHGDGVLRQPMGRDPRRPRRRCVLRRAHGHCGPRLPRPPLPRTTTTGTVHPPRRRFGGGPRVPKMRTPRSLGPSGVAGPSDYSLARALWLGHVSAAILASPNWGHAEWSRVGMDRRPLSGYNNWGGVQG